MPTSERSADSPVRPSRPRPGDDPALAAYRARNRRAMRRYAIVLALAVIVVVGLVKLVYARGELVHVSRQSAPSPQPILSAPTAATLTQKWQTTDHAATGDPYYFGLVVTYSAHTVNGRDARTGAVRWHYSRSDRELCGVVQQDASTIAIYRHDGNCDQVTGFVTATGEPKFYRTLVDNGETSISSAPNIVMTVAAGTVHVFDNAGGLDRWFWTAPDKCLVDRALAGSAGVLISYHCGTSYSLALHPLLDNDKPLLWTASLSERQVPFTAGAVVGAVDPRTGGFIRYTADKGTPRAAVALGSAGSVSSALDRLPRSQTTIEVSDDQGNVTEVAQADRLYGIDKNGKVTWKADTTDVPTQFDAHTIVIGSGRDVVQYDFSHGAKATHTRLAGQDALPEYLAYPVGSGLLIATGRTAFYAAIG